MADTHYYIEVIRSDNEYTEQPRPTGESLHDSAEEAVAPIADSGGDFDELALSAEERESFSGLDASRAWETSGYSNQSKESWSILEFPPR